MADEDTTIQDAIKEAAKDPAKASGDGWSVEHHPLPDLIDADRYIANRTAASSKKVLPIRRTKMVPPGTV